MRLHAGERPAPSGPMLAFTLLALLGATAWARPQAEAPPGASDLAAPTAEAESQLFLAPVPGLSQGWHRLSPGEVIGVPLGTTVTLHELASPDVAWAGALEVQTTERTSVAVRRFDAPGRHVVQSLVVTPDGAALRRSTAFEALEITADDVVVSSIEVAGAPLPLGEPLQASDVKHIFDYVPSIAAVTRVGDAHYRTSVFRELRVRAQVEPPELAWLLEWRLDGQIASQGAEAPLLIGTPGEHVLSTGPLSNPTEVRVDAYAVEVDGPLADGATFEDGEPLTFVAKTDPPGFEDEVLWLARTRHGTAVPALGYGRSFTVSFHGATGVNGDLSVGVMGDHGDQQVAIGFDLVGVLSVGGPLAIGNPIDSGDFEITKSFPKSGAPGTPVTLIGNFGGIPATSCTVNLEATGNTGTAFTIVAKGNKAVLARVDHHTTNSVPAPLALRKGNGAAGLEPPYLVGPYSIVFGDTWGWCGDPDDLMLGDVFTPLGGISVSTAGDSAGLASYEFVPGPGAGELQLVTPDVEDGSEGLLKLGFCWGAPGNFTSCDIISVPYDQIPGGGVVIQFEYDCGSPPCLIPQDQVAVGLEGAISFAFGQGQIPCTATTEQEPGFDKAVVVACPDTISLDGFLIGYFIVGDDLF